MDENLKLKFGQGNAKLGREVLTFALPAGHSCPGAKTCQAFVVMKTNDDGSKQRMLVDGKDQDHRCYAASLEVAFTATYNLVNHNFSILRAHYKLGGEEALTKLILRDLPKNPEKIRVHTDGDFFNQAYFNAWANVARALPNTLVYAYTKSLPFWLEARKAKRIPNNFVLTASRGGKHDHLIKKNRLREAIVVNHPSEAEALGLEIDHDDSHPQKRGGSFALLLHGIQSPGTAAAKAISVMKAEGVKFSYPHKKAAAKTPELVAA